MLRVALPALFATLLLLNPLGTASGGHDRAGTLVAGTGNLKLYPGTDHVITFSPPGAVGFDLFGEDVRYEYVRAFDSSGTYYRVVVLAPLGAYQVPWGIDWVFQGPSDVALSGAYGTDCVSLFCDDLPLP